MFSVLHYVLLEWAAIMPDQVSNPTTNVQPVRFLETDQPEAKPAAGMALCLSGGGYRAMLFHVGTIWRLNEAGFLPELRRVSSVSGGSITAGVLGMAWKKLRFGASKKADNLVEFFVKLLRDLAGVTIDAGSILEGMLMPHKTIADEVAAAYRSHLFDKATLQALPSDAEGPRFVINATNVQTRVLWRFSRPYMGDYRVGLIRNPEVELAVAVGASSAFPPFLSPAVLKLQPAAFDPTTKGDLQIEPYISTAVLTDGGVYDNLGLETAWKNYETILVSDGSGVSDDQPNPKRDWLQHIYRVLNLLDDQVVSLRKRQVVASYQMGIRKGAYWGIRTDIANYQLPDALKCPHDRTLALANTPTRLTKLDNVLQDRLINWGFAVSDAAIRKHVDGTLPAPTDFPYPASGV